MQARIIAANKICKLYLDQKIQQNHKIGFYKINKTTVIWKCSLDPNTDGRQLLRTFQREVLRRIHGPIEDKGRWRHRWNSGIYNLYKDLNIVEDIKIRRLRWASGVTRMEDERIPKKVLNGKCHRKRPVGRPRIRWEDVVLWDTSQILAIRGWRRRGDDREERSVFWGTRRPRRGCSATDGWLDSYGYWTLYVNNLVMNNKIWEYGAVGIRSPWRVLKYVGTFLDILRQSKERPQSNWVEHADYRSVGINNFFRIFSPPLLFTFHSALSYPYLIPHFLASSFPFIRPLCYNPCPLSSLHLLYMRSAATSYVISTLSSTSASSARARKQTYGYWHFYTEA